MKERGILFSAPMVRAILAGAKSQTRRAIKQRPAGEWAAPGKTACPYGAPGDRLWVREAWHAACDFNQVPPREIPIGSDIEHAATARSYAEIGLMGKLRPGMFMPRWASRITLEVTEVRVERLQNISEADALAEGVQRGYGGFHVDQGAHFHVADPRQSYFSLWEAINGPGSVEAKPWVWVVAFKRSEGSRG